jgi:hypothetical protein
MKNDLNFMFLIIIDRGTAPNDEMRKLKQTNFITPGSSSIPLILPNQSALK